MSRSGVQSAILVYGSPAEVQLAADSPAYAEWRKTRDTVTMKVPVWEWDAASDAPAAGDEHIPSMPER